MTTGQLKQVLGNGFTIAVLVGGIVGLGILRTPGEMARIIEAPIVYLSFWLGGGIFMLLSLAVLGELVSMAPRSGGPYSMVAYAYGSYPGFVIGWMDWATFPAILALKGVVIVEFAALLMPAVADYVTEGAILVTTFFALLQLVGVRTGSGIQRVASAGIGLIAVATACALFYGGASADIVTVESPAPAVPVPGGFAFLVSAIIFTYDGWLYATYFGGELKGGGRSAVIGALKGLVVVIGLYLALNAALVFAVPLSSIRGEDLAFATALDRLFGNGVGTFIILGALFTLLSQQNLAYMSGVRVLYALSIDGHGNQRATRVSDVGTPVGALLPTWMLAVVLILMGGFEFLLNLSVLLYILIYVGLMIAVFRLRRTQSEADRPYRALWHPWLGIAVTLGWTGFAVYIAVSNPMSAINTVGLIAVSLPVYLVVHRGRATDART